MTSAKADAAYQCGALFECGVDHSLKFRHVCCVGKDGIPTSCRTSRRRHLCAEEDLWYATGGRRVIARRARRRGRADGAGRRAGGK
jgi:hypothetical protein